MWRRALIWLAILAACGMPVGGDTELVLLDGQVLRGIDLRRDGEEYVLTLKSGDEVAFPVVLVESVRLVGGIERHPAPSPLRTDLEPENLAGTPVPGGPTGTRHGDPETLAGQPFDPPSRSEQMKALGPPAEFQKGIVDNRWEPTSDWDMSPENNNFNPSTWAEGPIDPNWQPESAFDPDEDVLESSRSTWQKSIIDNTWTPTDGFKSSVGRR